MVEALYMLPVMANCTYPGQPARQVGRFHVACGTTDLRRIDRRLSRDNRIARARTLFAALPGGHGYAGFIISTLADAPAGFEMTSEDFYHERH